MLTDKQRIEHMIETADILLQIMANTTKEEYASSIEKQFAVKFAFVMLGEDAAQLSDELKNKAPSIPWKQIKATRNIVAHDYNKTDEEILWETVYSDILPLRNKLAEIKDSM